jgi:outer membrane protein OmpA-like peptidoglycan-associated protein
MWIKTLIGILLWALSQKLIGQTLDFNKSNFKVGDYLVRDELFNPDCHITPSGFAFVDSLAAFLVKNTSVSITIEFHTDIRGSAKLNKSRTEVCGKGRLQGYFQHKYNIDESRISYACLGEDKPLVSEKEISKIKDKKAKEIALAKNRRTVVIITKVN